MKELKTPHGEDFNKLKEIVNFNSEEQKYWDDMEKRRDSQFQEKDLDGRIKFYLNELKSIQNRFVGRAAVQRQLSYITGYAYEYLGTYISEGKNPKDRYPMFENAVIWYQKADEIIGYITDYALRQSESCGGAAKFRKEAGLEDEITRWFSERAGQLLSAFLGGREVLVINEKIPDYIKALADKKISGVADSYLFDIKKKMREN